MIRWGIGACVLLPFWLGIAVVGTASASEHKLPLTASMLINETAVGDASGLVDEQDAVGDPATKHGNAPKNPFFPGWAKWPYPVHVAIDLGAKHHLTRAFFYNETGQNYILLSYGRPFAWTDKSIVVGAYKDWVAIPLNIETRWLRITLTHPISIPEMVLYGEPLEKPTPAARPNPPIRRIHPTMDAFIGANVFIDDPIDTIAPVCGFAREYHSWSWDVENPDHKRRFQPSAAGGGSAWFFDDYYRKLKARGVTVSPAIQNSVPDFFGGAKPEYKPVADGANAEDPAAYALHSAHLFQYAARYGGHPVSDPLLDLAPGQPRKSGLGLLNYIEDWNEPDRTWNDRQGRFQPYELAAMSSADRDGHLGKMGAAHGVRTADPSMKLVLGGLAGLDLNYLRAMKFWADWNRGGSFPADVINLHHYSSNGNEQGWAPNGHGISPEDDHLREKMTAIATWRDASVPAAELWLTEFGYDTNHASPLHAPSIGTMSAEQVQAAWLVRSYLALAAAGVDRAAMFMLRDVNSKGGGVFETCGLVTEKGQWKPKPSWFYVATLRSRLAGYRFTGDVASGRDDVRIYRFDNAGTGARCYAVWCPTSSDLHVKGFALPVRGSTARTVELVAGSPTGRERNTQVTGGRASIDVSETPILVFEGPVAGAR